MAEANQKWIEVHREIDDCGEGLIVEVDEAILRPRTVRITSICAGGYNISTHLVPFSVFYDLIDFGDPSED